MDYDDIIHLPHFEPKRHPRMAMAARAAQFAPFAAVAGHEDAIREEGRTTDTWTAPGELGNEALNRKMLSLVPLIAEQPAVAIEYFLPDSHKAGGTYQTIAGRLKRIDDMARLIELTNGKKIPIDLIKDIRKQ